MPGPYASDRNVYADIPLSNFAVAAFADTSADEGLISNVVAPAIPVAKQSASYYVFDPDSFFKQSETARAAGTKANKIHWTVSSANYQCTGFALADDIPYEDLQNEDAAIGLRENTVRLLVGRLKLGQEIRIANLLTSISNVGSGVVLSGSDKWSNYVGSDPIAAVNTGHAFIRQRTGLIANAMAMDYDTMKILQRHPIMLDMYKYTEGGVVPLNKIADAFGVKEIAIAQSIRDMTREGAATSMVSIWGNNVVLMHKGQVGLRSTTPVVRFQWKFSEYPANFGVLISAINEAGSEHVERIETGYYQDERIVARDLAYTIGSTL